MKYLPLLFLIISACTNYEIPEDTCDMSKPDTIYQELVGTWTGTMVLTNSFGSISEDMVAYVRLSLTKGEVTMDGICGDPVTLTISGCNANTRIVTGVTCTRLLGDCPMVTTTYTSGKVGWVESDDSLEIELNGTMEGCGVTQALEVQFTGHQ